MAHDGSDWGMMDQAGRGPKQAAGVLVARCVSPGCGAQSSLSGPEWAEAGGTLPLRAFETRLRCACGARRVRLEPGVGAPPPVNPAIYRFR